MKILIACEESQTVTVAFRKLGYEAYSCDIQECSGGHPEWHIIGDAIAEAYSGKYDLMIAHPPCTYMSKAGARWMFPTAGNISQERLSKALEAKEFFLKLLTAPIKYIAVENPFPLKVVGLPKETQAIQPYQFGEPFSKNTLLWLKGLPKLIPTKVLTEYVPLVKSNTGGKKRGQIARPNNLTAKETSKTFQGIADAMAKQWMRFIEWHSLKPQSEITILQWKKFAKNIGRNEDLFLTDERAKDIFAFELNREFKKIGIRPIFYKNDNTSFDDRDYEKRYDYDISD